MALEINLHNKVALVTGVTSGIGKGVAKMLAKAGCHVAGCGRSSKKSKEALFFKEIVERENVDSFYQQVNVTDFEELHKFVKNVSNELGSIDIVVSNAGANVFYKPEECTQEQWQFNMDLNLGSHWHLSKYCKPYLERSSNGVIIIMTSNHAFTTIPNCFPYNITKTALTGFVRSLAVDWGPKIRTIGIAPGFIETEGGKKWFQSFPDPVIAKNKIMAIHPVKKLGDVEDIGAFCAFLSSNYAKFITGITYLIDGGRSAIMQDI